MKKTTTRFFTLTDSELSFEIRQGNRNLCGRVCLQNGSFAIDFCSFDLLTFKKELDIVLSVCDKLISDIANGKKN